MSTVYSVKETLKIKNEDNYELIVRAIRSRYALLGGLMLNNDAEVFEMKLKADGKEYSFSGETVTPDFKELLDAMSVATELELNASYSGFLFGEIDVAPSFVSDLVEQLLDEKAVDVKDFFYSMHYYDVCGQEFGALSVYGEKDGKQYCGFVNINNEMNDVEDFPAEGNWHTIVDPFLCFGADDPSREKEKNIISVCQTFLNENAEYGINRDGDEIALEIDAISLKSKKDFDSFLSICKELYCISDYFFLMGLFIDCSGDVPRFLELDINDDGNYTIKIAAV